MEQIKRVNQRETLAKAQDVVSFAFNNTTSSTGLTGDFSRFYPQKGFVLLV
jgi:hypothetical protein